MNNNLISESATSWWITSSHLQKISWEYKTIVQWIVDNSNKLPNFISEESVINFIRAEIISSCSELSIEWLSDFVLSSYWFVNWKISKDSLYETFDFKNSEIKSAWWSLPVSEEDIKNWKFEPKIYISTSIDNAKDFLVALSHEIFHSILEIYFLAYQNDILKKTFSDNTSKKLIDQKHEILAYMHGANFTLKNNNFFSIEDVNQAAWMNVNTWNSWYDSSASISSSLISVRNRLYNISSPQLFQVFCMELNNFILQVDNFDVIILFSDVLVEATKWDINDFRFYLENLYHDPNLLALHNDSNFQIFRDRVLSWI